jgi:hypothetical protein
MSFRALARYLAENSPRSLDPQCSRQVNPQTLCEQWEHRGMAQGSPDCLNLYDGDDPRNVHRTLQSAGLTGQNPTVIKGVEANAECSTRAEDTSRVVTRVGGTEQAMTHRTYILVDLHTYSLCGELPSYRSFRFPHLPAEQSNPKR